MRVWAVLARRDAVKEVVVDVFDEDRFLLTANLVALLRDVAMHPVDEPVQDAEFHEILDRVLVDSGLGEFGKEIRDLKARCELGIE